MQTLLDPVTVTVGATVSLPDSRLPGVDCQLPRFDPTAIDDLIISLIIYWPDDLADVVR